VRWVQSGHARGTKVTAELVFGGRKNKGETMKLEGVPDGWELVRIGRPVAGEWSIGGDGIPWEYTKAKQSEEVWPIVRKLDPIATWKRGVFADGWLFQDADGEISFSAGKPTASVGEGYWIAIGGTKPIRSEVFQVESLVLFRQDMSWTERVISVGPSVEK